MKYLLKSKYKVNDGSLHEAARNLHSDVVAALLKGSHDPNFPSSRPEHSGRTPLQELAYRCQGTNRLNDIEDTIVALYKGKADPLRRWREDNSQYHGKNSLFLALDNVCPLEVTQALLDTIMWQHMDNVENVVTSTDLATGITFTRSANIYLRDFKENSKQTWQLTQLLQTKGCTDRMYAQFGAFQPPNAIGLPDDIAKEDKRRRAEMEKSQKTEAEHREKLRRIEEESNTKLTMDQSKFEAWQAQEYERAIHKVGSAAIIHENQLHQKAQLTAQEQQALALKNALQQRALDQKNATTEQHKVRTAFVGQAALQHEQQLKLNFAQQTADQKAAAQKNQNYLAQQAAIQKVALQKTQNNLAKQAGQQKLANQRSANQLAMKARR